MFDFSNRWEVWHMTDDGDITRKLIYDFIVQYKRDHDGLSPTFDEIAEGCYLSRAGVKYHLPILQLQGILRIGGRRGIEVIGGAWVPPDEAEGTDAKSDEAGDDPSAVDSDATEALGDPDHDDARTAGD
jgi:hypothetical protein